MVTQADIQKMTQTIVQKSNPYQIYLFGSYAKGTALPSSDLDFLIIEDRPFTAENSRLKEIRAIKQVLSSWRISKDVLLYSRDETDKWKTSLNHIVAQCFREGKLLYARH